MVTALPYLRQVHAPVRFLSAEPLLGDVAAMADDLHGIDWVITGPQSGPGAIPPDPAWYQNLARITRKANAALYYKNPRPAQPQELPEPAHAYPLPASCGAGTNETGHG
jgi:protein gp37